jgi:hypothetical protein
MTLRRPGSIWYPLFQTQWDKCDKQNHQAYNYVVTGHHLHKRT